MGINTERLVLLPSEAPSVRRRKSEAIQAATRRAEVRLAIARLAAYTNGTLADKRRVVEATIRAGHIKQASVPCVETIRTLEAKWNAGLRSAADYRDDLTPRGPRRRGAAPEVVELIRQRAVTHGIGNVTHLIDLVRRDAVQRNLPAPSAWTVRRILTEDIGLPAIIAGRHGSRAAEMHAFPRGAYPTRRTHELWHLDETALGYWARGFCRVEEIWVPLLIWGIPIRDHRSGALVSDYLADPTDRIDPLTGFCAQSGFDSTDVLASLLTATSRDLASTGCADLAGALPERLRWDNASAHIHLERTIFDHQLVERDTTTPHPDDEAADDQEDKLLLPTERIRVRRPDRNGNAERLMGYLKDRMVGIRGRTDEYIPDVLLRKGADLGRHRALLTVQSSDVPTRLTPIPLMALPTVPMLRARFSDVVRQYNTERKLKRNALTPAGAAQFYMPESVRRGEDLIRALPLESFTVTKEGIAVERNGKRVAFDPVANGIVMRRGAVVQVYVDPRLRCLWLEQHRRLVQLRPAEEVAAEVTAADAAATTDDAARRLSDQAAAIRAARLDAECGDGTAARGQEAYETTRDEPKDSAPPRRRPRGRPSDTAEPKPRVQSSHTSTAASVRAIEDSLHAFDYDPEDLIPGAPDNIPEM